MRSKYKAYNYVIAYGTLNRGLRATSRGLAVTDSLMAVLLLTNKLYDHATTL